MRVLHFSDVHVGAPAGELPLRELLGKRALGLANLQLRRARQFRQARHKLQALARLADAQGVELVLCTGDYTALGTHPELRAARAAIDPLTHASHGFCTVPGNHDLYMPDAVADRRFDTYFGEFMHTHAPELSIDGVWPLVRFVSDEVAVVAVQSARPNPQPWRSSGRVREGELDALSRVLEDPRVQQRFVFIITHYAPRLPTGGPDAWAHGLENADAFLERCAKVRRGVVLHGHVHWRYHLAIEPGRPPLFGAGSATCEGREGVWLFDVAGDQVRAVPGRWSADAYVLDSDQAITL